MTGLHVDSGAEATIGRACPLAAERGKPVVAVTKPFWSDSRGTMVAIVDEGGEELSCYPVSWLEARSACREGEGEGNA